MDTTENIRRAEVARINSEAAGRAVLLTRYPQVWNTEEIRAEFEVLGFMAPFCVVRRKSDGVKGSLEFQHDPRFYFNFVAD
jgi:hypothetical protein